MYIQVLLSIFLSASIAIYIFLSYIFFKKGIEAGQPLKLASKDWIKVNAYVSFPLALLFLFTAFVALVVPGLLTMFADIMINQELLKAADKAAFIRDTQIRLGLGGIFALALIIHIIITFKLLKQYDGLFKD